MKNWLAKLLCLLCRYWFRRHRWGRAFPHPVSAVPWKVCRRCGTGALVRTRARKEAA